jgi:tetratricopeptide (TPR) repeat protein
MTAITLCGCAQPARPPAALTLHAKAVADAESFARRGDAAVEVGSLAEALAMYSHALRLDPQCSRAVVGRQNVLQLTGESPATGTIVARTQRRPTMRGAIAYRFELSLGMARDATVGGDLETASAALSHAEAASNARADLFTDREVEDMRARVVRARRAVAEGNPAGFDADDHWFAPTPPLNYRMQAYSDAAGAAASRDEWDEADRWLRRAEALVERTPPTTERTEFEKLKAANREQRVRLNDQRDRSDAGTKPAPATAGARPE